MCVNLNKEMINFYLSYFFSSETNLNSSHFSKVFLCSFSMKQFLFYFYKGAVQTITHTNVAREGSKNSIIVGQSKGAGGLVHAPASGRAVHGRDKKAS